MNPLTISQHIYEEMLTHLLSVYPMEGCGLLAGLDGRVHRHYAIDNRLDSSSAFEMEPAQLIAAMMDLEAQELELLAIYHSHPHGPAVPSPTDIVQANYPDTVQIIVSFDNPTEAEGKAFQIVEGRVTAVTLKIV